MSHRAREHNRNFVTPATAIKERPILFSGEMVRAILAGRKTQTRRVVKGASGQFWDHAGWRPVVFDGAITAWKSSRCRSPNGPAVHCPYGKPGDRLWVREAWAPVCEFDPELLGALYRSDCVNGEIPHRRRAEKYKWRPSIHMPRWASRITLQITDVRVERVQEISDGDCLSEGMDAAWKGQFECGHLNCDAVDKWHFGPGWQFVQLWDSINGDRDGCSWAANPYVWVVEFERLENES